MPEHLEEDFLRHVLALCARDAEKPDDSNHPDLVSRHKGLERSGVARAGSLDEDIVLLVFDQNELLFPRASTAMTEK